LGQVRRRNFLIVVGALLGAPFPIEAQQSKAVVIGWFGSGSFASYAGDAGSIRDVLIEVLRHRHHDPAIDAVARRPGDRVIATVSRRVH